MKRIKRFGITLVCSALLFSTVYAYGADKIFPIGALFPMTGPQAFYGRVMSRGAQMAVQHLNSSGGVEGYKLRLVITDFKNIDTSAGVVGMQKMIRMDKIPFVLVSFSAVILAAQPVCEASHVLMLNPGAYSPKLMDKPYLYSTKLLQPQMIPPMLNYFYAMGIRKLGLIYVSNPAGEPPAKEIVEPVWTKMGGTIAASMPHPPGLTDYSDYLSKIKAGNPDAIYDISTGQDQAYLIKGAREQGMNIPITVPDWSPDYYKIAGKSSENVYIPGDHFDSSNPDPDVRRFVKEYESAWKESPEIFAANYYEAVFYVLPELIRRVVKNQGNPLDGAELEKAIWTDPVFKTLYGATMTLKKNGTVNKPMAVFKIVNGEKTVEKQVVAED